MAIQQTKKQSDLEKRLKLLRRQIYGKSSEHSENSVNQKNQSIRESDNLTHLYVSPILSDSPSHSESFRTDITYLHQDLLKILLLAGSAIGLQIILFFAEKQSHGLFTLLQNHIVNINFFWKEVSC